MSDPNFLDMSDDELLAFDLTSLEAGGASGNNASDAADPDAESQGAATDPEGVAEGGTEQAGETQDALDESDTAGADASDTGDAGVNVDASQDQADSDKKEELEGDTSRVNFEAEYKRLLTPFKANGRDIAVQSVDDAIALMQMGANYNKKMAALKPNLKLLKLLENNQLLSEEKLSFLIDLSKKDSGAINKLVKDSGLDPMDLSAEKAGDYKPQSYKVDDREIELDTVLDELQGTQAYSRTLDIVSNKWDGASKKVIAESPQLLKVINNHVDRGFYDLIVAEVDRERVFGRLNGLSDIEAYRQVGDAIQARGGFDHLAGGRTPQGQQTPAPKVVVPPKPKQADDDKLRDKRRAASSTKPVTPSTAGASDFNPLALSDDEFSKIGLKKFL